VAVAGRRVVEVTKSGLVVSLDAAETTTGLVLVDRCRCDFARLPALQRDPAREWGRDVRVLAMDGDVVRLLYGGAPAAVLTVDMTERVRRWAAEPSLAASVELMAERGEGLASIAEVGVPVIASVAAGWWAVVGVDRTDHLSVQSLQLRDGRCQASGGATTLEASLLVDALVAGSWLFVLSWREMRPTVHVFDLSGDRPRLVDGAPVPLPTPSNLDHRRETSATICAYPPAGRRSVLVATGAAVHVLTVDDGLRLATVPLGDRAGDYVSRAVFDGRRAVLLVGRGGGSRYNVYFDSFDGRVTTVTDNPPVVHGSDEFVTLHASTRRTAPPPPLTTEDRCFLPVDPFVVEADVGGTVPRVVTIHGVPDVVMALDVVHDVLLAFCDDATVRGLDLLRQSDG